MVICGRSEASSRVVRLRGVRHTDPEGYSFAALVGINPHVPGLGRLGRDSCHVHTGHSQEKPEEAAVFVSSAFGCGSGPPVGFKVHSVTTRGHTWP